MAIKIGVFIFHRKQLYYNSKRGVCMAIIIKNRVYIGNARTNTYIEPAGPFS